MGFFENIVSTLANSNPIGQLINTGASLVTSALNRHQSKETNKANAYQNELSRDFTAEQSELDRQFNSSEAQKSREFNSLEAQKSREFNSFEAAKQREFEERMWSLQNEYNSPSNQIDLLRQAGMNPNLYGGDATAASVGSSASATSSPAVSSPASHGSLGAPSSIPMQPFVRSNPLLDSAQIRLLSAQAKKEMSESNKMDTESNRIKQLLSGELMLQDSQYHVNLSEQMRNEASAKESLQNVEALEAKRQEIFASIDEIRQNISNLEKEGRLTEKQIDAFEKKLAMEFYEALSRVKMHGAAATSYLASADASNTQARLNEEQQKFVCQQVIHQSIQNGIASIDFRIKDKTEVSNVRLINSANDLRTNDCSVQNQDDWRYARLFFGTLGQVMNANLNISDVTKANR